jgi:hypothetical protein
MAKEWDIAVERTVRRREDIHGGAGLEARFGGAWYGGIEPSSITPNVFIFSEPATGTLYGYNFDGWAPGDILHYTGEGKKGDQRLVEGNRAIENHRGDGRSLRVFEANPPFATYLGEFELCDDPPYLWADAPESENGPIRSVIVFRLRPTGQFSRGTLPDAQTVDTPGASSIPAEVETPVAAEIPPEANAAAAFTVAPSDEPVEYQRREAALVDRYKAYLTRKKRPFSRRRVTIPGEAGRLYTDLHDDGMNELIEAKASNSRNGVRSGLGQLLDYRRFVAHERLALLLPSKPRPDLIALLFGHGCAVIWELTPGMFERADPPKT